MNFKPNNPRKYGKTEDLGRPAWHFRDLDHTPYTTLKRGRIDLTVIQATSVHGKKWLEIRLEETTTGEKRTVTKVISVTLENEEIESLKEYING